MSCVGDDGMCGNQIAALFPDRVKALEFNKKALDYQGFRTS
jgi:hypothetical protein